MTRSPIPDFDGAHEDWTGDERAQLLWFLNLQRDLILWKCEELSDDQLRTPHPPSTMTLGGLLKHLTRVERSWLQQDLVGPDQVSFDFPADEWTMTEADRGPALVGDYLAAITRSNEMIGRHDLSTVLADPHPDQRGVTLRWALFHMIEETARHAGHADLIREAIDGTIGQNRWHP